MEHPVLQVKAAMQADDAPETQPSHVALEAPDDFSVRAFYRAALAIGGNAWEIAGKIWYRTVASRVRHDTGFIEFARATAAVSTEMCGSRSREHDAVIEAWSAVGIEVSTSTSARPRKRTLKKEAQQPDA